MSLKITLEFWYLFWYVWKKEIPSYTIVQLHISGGFIFKFTGSLGKTCYKKKWLGKTVRQGLKKDPLTAPTQKSCGGRPNNFFGGLIKCFQLLQKMFETKFSYSYFEFSMKKVFRLVYKHTILVKWFLK